MELQHESNERLVCVIQWTTVTKNIQSKMKHSKSEKWNFLFSDGKRTSRKRLWRTAITLFGHISHSLYMKITNKKTKEKIDYTNVTFQKLSYLTRAFYDVHIHLHIFESNCKLQTSKQTLRQIERAEGIVMFKTHDTFWRIPRRATQTFEDFCIF